jgi:tetratricopeptide (TPR) repeat protein/predicted aspartyl protease
MRAAMKIAGSCGLGFCVLFAHQARADDCKLSTYGTLPLEMVGPRAMATVKINGRDARFIIDTGAFFNIMSSANASALGLSLRPAPFGLRIGGVGGSASTQITHVKEFGILDTTLNDIDFLVGGSDTGYGVLGASLLDAADLELDLAHGKLALFKAEHCDKASLAYWSKDGSYNVADIESSDSRTDRRTFLKVIINGTPVRAVLDSGATATVLSRRAAERIGIDLHAPDVKTGASSIGFGARQVKTLTVHIDSFSVGTETIKNSQMQVLDGNFGDSGTDMLLAVDFILAHHMFIASSERKVYFTYNGGRVFTFADTPTAEDKSADNAKDDALKTAPEYAMRGEAHLSRGEAEAALSDMDAAIGMAPGQAAYYVSRARAYEANKQFDAALADLDKSLSLDPKNVDALLMRAELRYAHRDHTAAAVDAATASALAPAGSAQARSIAALYVRLGQPAAALPLLDDWIRLHDNDAMLGSTLSERCLVRGLINQMLDDAWSDCRKAIKRDGDNPVYLENLGLVLLRLGHYPDSIKAYEQALASRPKSGWLRYGLGAARIRNGQTDAGQADLAAARVLDPKIDAMASKYGLTTTGR